jgi:hypothetical protein
MRVPHGPSAHPKSHENYGLQTIWANRVTGIFRALAVWALQVGSVLLAATNGFAASPPVTGPNIILIGVDDMADWIGEFAAPGYPIAHTPNLDRLMKNGIVFTQAYCVSPVCGPSRAAVLTGLRPETSKVYGNVGTYLDYAPHAVAFPEYLRKHGYHD